MSEEFDVVIVGAGPVGVTAANFLGMYGIKTLIIEQESTFYTYPRTVSIDDDVLRVFQSIGLIEKQLADTLEDVHVEFYTSSGKLLMSTDPPKIRRYGFSRAVTVLQQLIEENLREGLKRFDCVEFKLGHAFKNVSKETNSLKILISNNDQEYSIKAKYLLACDGGKSTVRKVCGINLVALDEPDAWLVVDLIDNKKLSATVKLYGDPARPTVQVPLPRGYQRWEFRLFPNENHTEIENNELLVNQWLSRWIDIKDIEIIRRRVYAQSSRIAEKFQIGKIFLLGDAAHLMPPFAGQGLCSGIRDAANISWKLALVLKSQANERILLTYEQERKPHIVEAINGTKKAGQVFFPKTYLLEFLRNTLLRIALAIPAVKKKIDHDGLKPTPFYKEGLLIKSDFSGHLLVQPKIKKNNVILLLDEVLGKSFSIIGINIDPQKNLNQESKIFWESLGSKFLYIVKSKSDIISQPNSEIVEDYKEELSKQFLSQSAVIVIRPDRYIALSCEPANFNYYTKLLQSRFVN